MSYNFSIEKENIFTLTPDGSGSVFITATDYKIPQTMKGAPPNLQVLYDMMKSSNDISFEYYVRATGRVSSHDCEATYTLYTASKLDDNSYTSLIALASTSDSPGSGGGVDSGWKNIYKGPRLIKTVSTRQECSGSGCWCAFQSKGGWSETKISLRVVVNVNLKNYCLKDPSNLHEDLCYNYISNTYNKKLPQGVSDLAKKYCDKKYPYGQLSLFSGKVMDEKDKNICGCNMTDEAYNIYTSAIKKNFPNMSLGSINPRCIFPDCVDSSWQGPALNGCPIPKCFNVVNFNDSSITADVVDIKQNSECANYYGKPSETKPEPSKPADKPTEDKIMEFMDEYKVYIILGTILLTFLVILGVYLAKRKN